MTKYEKADVFNDREVTADPYPYFEYLRSIGPVAPDPVRDDVVHVTGYEEGVAVAAEVEGVVGDPQTQIEAAVTHYEVAKLDPRLFDFQVPLVRIASPAVEPGRTEAPVAER